MAVTGGVAHWTVMSLLLGRVSLVAGSEVRGVPGQSITLPCRYSVGKSGESKMCWGRGHCTVMGCGAELIRTNGHTVTSTTSPRYHLGGRIEEGDVSLTINNLQREDSGSYCCRVEIPGPFNDQKVIMNLQVLDETSSPSPLATKPSTASPSTTAEFFSTGYGNNVAPLTSQGTQEILSSPVITNGMTTTSGAQENMELPLYLGIGLLFLISVTGIITIIFLKKLKNSTKKYNSNNANGLHMHQLVEENIYQVPE